MARNLTGHRGAGKPPPAAPASRDRATPEPSGRVVTSPRGSARRGGGRREGTARWRTGWRPWTAAPSCGPGRDSPVRCVPGPPTTRWSTWPATTTSAWPPTRRSPPPPRRPCPRTGWAPPGHAWWRLHRRPPRAGGRPGRLARRRPGAVFSSGYL
ncbi:8-amino-7-oxononanoate synthase, partial [Micromonospora sp. M42]